VAPVLNQINLVVGDMAASVAFYRRLGVLDLPEDAAMHTEAAFPGLSLELDDASSARWWHAGWRADQRPRAVVTFHVDGRDEVDRIYRDLTGAGHRAVQPPHDAFFGSRYAIVADPVGTEVALISDRDMARNGPPVEESPAP
jgi:uncharacterized glyoxalase superfamily protein PhnB